MCITRMSLCLMINAGKFFDLKQRLIFGGHVRPRVNWEELAKWELMKSTRRPNISLSSETGTFLWKHRLLISVGPLLSLLRSGSTWSLHSIVGGGGGRDELWNAVVCFQLRYIYWKRCRQRKLLRTSLPRMQSVWRHPVNSIAAVLLLY